MNLREATQEISGYVGSKYGRRTIQTRTYLVLRFYRFTRHGWLLAKRHAFLILQKYSYWNIRSLSGVVYVVSCIAIQYHMSHARPGAGEVSAPYEAHIGYQAAGLFESDNHDLVILSRWLQHYRELVLNPCMIIISICLK